MFCLPKTAWPPTCLAARERMGNTNEYPLSELLSGKGELFGVGLSTTIRSSVAKIGKLSGHLLLVRCFAQTPDVEMYGLVLRWMERLNQEVGS